MSDKATKLQVVKNNRSMVTAFTAAAGFMRGIAIKRYAPKVRRREFTLLEQSRDSHRTRCQIFREKGAGNVPTIVLGGFVPDATETVEFQRALLRQHGSIYYVNYARTGFCQDMFAAQLTDLLEDLERKGQKPLVMALIKQNTSTLFFFRHNRYCHEIQYHSSKQHHNLTIHHAKPSNKRLLRSFIASGIAFCKKFFSLTCRLW